MWQRIQTVWLLIASTLMIVFPWQDLLYLTHIGKDLFYTLTAWGLEPLNTYNTAQMGVSAIGILSLLSAVFSFATIFLFKKRVLQMRFCVFNALLLLAIIGLIVFLTWFYIRELNVELVGAKFWLAFPCVSFILQLLARRGILKDETLIRMSNRLR